jgi:SAM-dependent methyltransferase
MEPEGPRLAAWWPFVSAHLPAPPARVLEIGCGPAGGFVPALRDAGFDAVGVDPHAPDGADYDQVEFERYVLAGPVEAVVACTSLHHVADLGAVLDQVVASLAPGGTLVVLEWAWERFDAPTAEWCFAHLEPLGAGDDPGWLHEHRARWAESGLSWGDYLRGWAAAEGLHTGCAQLAALSQRFATRLCAEAPYFFGDLAGFDEPAEQAAIDSGHIQPNGIRYVGVPR